MSNVWTWWPSDSRAELHNYSSGGFRHIRTNAHTHEQSFNAHVADVRSCVCVQVINEKLMKTTYIVWELLVCEVMNGTNIIFNANSSRKYFFLMGKYSAHVGLVCACACVRQCSGSDASIHPTRNVSFKMVIQIVRLITMINSCPTTMVKYFMFLCGVIYWIADWQGRSRILAWKTFKLMFNWLVVASWSVCSLLLGVSHSCVSYGRLIFLLLFLWRLAKPQWASWRTH